MDLTSLGPTIAERRKTAKLTQSALAELARVSVPTLKALEQGRAAELGFSKLLRILTALGLELELREANRGRPTLDTLRSEASDD
ncbi:MAG TPA: helix-turn-helix domain-containing protein [Acidobacteriaceae bacterium]|nr:helix-turn-helix domain-containing protein [Acidobacteriaceae bacterium]